MKKEEIIEISRKENKNKDMYAIQVESRAATIAGLTMLILATFYYVYEITSGKGSNPALYSIISIYNAILFGYKAIKIKEKRVFDIFVSVIWSLLTIILILNYFKVI